MKKYEEGSIEMYLGITMIFKYVSQHGVVAPNNRDVH